MSAPQQSRDFLTSQTSLTGFDNLQNEILSKSVTAGHGTAKPVIDLRDLEYVYPVNLNLVCPICRCPFIEPMRLACDHTFCRYCLKTSLENQCEELLKSCPTCRRATRNSEMLPLPRFLVNMVDELPVRCPNVNTGCAVEPRRGDVTTHVDAYCDYTEVRCSSSDCQMVVRRIDRGDSCVHAKLCCRFCRLEIMRKDFKDHLDYHCTQYVSQCMLCKTKSKSYEVDNHAKECSKVTESCPAFKIGCRFISNRDELNKHQIRCPLAVILPTLNSMARLIENQQSALKIQQHKCETLESQFSSSYDFSGQGSFQPTNFHVDNASENKPDSLIKDLSHGLNVLEVLSFDSTARHLLSVHESLRIELDRVSASVSELDARLSMMIMNESLRTKEDLVHTNAAIGSLRMQVQWVTSARLQSQIYNSHPGVDLTKLDTSSHVHIPSTTQPAHPVRRLSDTSYKETKL